ncbi:hypothetical protein TRIP_D250066 [uncultured Paludibacter sp.]|uniref:Uncharacterized protein n=1 Tax=uncultured Paludibacter sp. TaxID=497635 RepID=A0A653A8E1_9BACT|nr:hypothetical protein TRIP_D250066 [uncultured Paludibacter sp.]
MIKHQTKKLRKEINYPQPMAIVMEKKLLLMETRTNYIIIIG